MGSNGFVSSVAVPPEEHWVQWEYDSSVSVPARSRLYPVVVDGSIDGFFVSKTSYEGISFIVDWKCSRRYALRKLGRSKPRVFESI